MAALIRQFFGFAGVGALATVIHYTLLVALHEGAHVPVVPATLCGATAGATFSYVFVRRHVFASTRSHEEAGWRFAVIACVAFVLTGGAMHLLVDLWHAPYIPAQMLTTGLVLFWNFTANRFWTFAEGA